MWPEYSVAMRNSVTSLLLGLVFGLLAGTNHANSQCTYPQQPPYGTNTQCYNQSYCGGSGWGDWMCIYMPCSVTGQEAHDGCPTFTRVEECIWMGCFNFFDGNCMGC